MQPYHHLNGTQCAKLITCSQLQMLLNRMLRYRAALACADCFQRIPSQTKPNRNLVQQRCHSNIFRKCIHGYYTIFAHSDSSLMQSSQLQFTCLTKVKSLLHDSSSWSTSCLVHWVLCWGPWKAWPIHWLECELSAIKKSSSCAPKLRACAPGVDASAIQAVCQRCLKACSAVVWFGATCICTKSGHESSNPRCKWGSKGNNLPFN